MARSDVPLPFSLFKRAGRRFFYVQFKSKGGGYLPAVSTGQTDKASAMETAFRWLRDGRPAKPGKKGGPTDGDGGGPISHSLRDAVRGVGTAAEAEFVCGELKRRGLLRAYAVAGSDGARDFGEFLLDFWDYDNSPYVKERLRRNHGIHRNYVAGQRLSVGKYWEPFFRGRALGDVSGRDVDRFIDDLAGRRLSAGRRNIILKAGTIPLRWAFSKELVEKDVTAGITWFSGKARETRILTPEIAGAVFRLEWADERARLANMLAAVTGLRAGEIQGLRACDLGGDRLRVRHSWNFRDGLKTTKNNEPRDVEVPFPALIDGLLELAGRNPHGAGPGGYVFWADRSPSKPMEGRLFAAGLRDALERTGMDAESAAGYVFHGWRHFFTTYMISRLERKLLKSQTGHKTDSMLSRYGEHWAEGDREKIRTAQIETFGGLVPTGDAATPPPES